MEASVTHTTLEATISVPSRPIYATVYSSFRLDSSDRALSPDTRRTAVRADISRQTSELRSTLLLSLPQQLRHRFSGRTQCSGSLVWQATSGSQPPQDPAVSQTAQHTTMCREGEADTVPSAACLPAFQRNAPPSLRSVKWLKTNDRKLHPIRPDCCDAVNTCIGNVIWFASNGIICTGLRKVQYCEILWRVLTMVSAFNLLKRHCMYRPVVTICTTSLTFQQFYVLSTQCIYVFCADLRTNSNYFPIQHQLTGFYNRDLTQYSPVVTICTASLTFNNSTFCPHSVFVCFVRI